MSEQQRQRAQAAKDPFADDFKTAVKVGLASGSAGFLFGGAVGILKGLPTFLSAGATSLQTFGLGAVFTQTRLTIIRAWTTEQQLPTPGELTTATAVAGGFSGGAIGALFRGRRNVVPGAIMWSIFGATGQVLYNRWSAVPQQSVARGPGFWKRMSEKSWTPFTVLSNEEYAEMLKEKMLKVDVELSILDDKIAAIKEQQKAEIPRQTEPEAKTG
ncbi:hypothetical protein Slin15195_G035420 [Septoria linicola]|uniref:Uncharacterized protein n=1 Tax=Septoria linicola TaxID=215465 RepID=A0A9Q9EID2_9PEZI|nr:hypothetical protein Slin14017_G116780 [Septoria linicola]USW50223.1 hypothetical protein Slin15195_G035420 [Septoria linicola]